MRAGREGACLPPALRSAPSPRALQVARGAAPAHLLGPRKTGPSAQPSPVPLSSSLPGSQLRQRLPPGKSRLHGGPALGPLGGFLVPSQGRWGPCLISEAEPSHGTGLVSGQRGTRESGI